MLLLRIWTLNASVAFYFAFIWLPSFRPFVFAFGLDRRKAGFLSTFGKNTFVEIVAYSVRRVIAWKRHMTFGRIRGYFAEMPNNESEGEHSADREFATDNGPSSARIKFPSPASEEDSPPVMGK